MYCVIVGDIINSREIDYETREEVTAAIKNTLNRINTENMEFLMADFGLVRGDAFEGVLLSASNVPAILQDIIKSSYAVHKTKVRISVVLGQLTKTGSDRNETDGPAFYQAFEKLDKMKEKKSTHWLQVSIETNSVVQPVIDSGLQLLAAITERWTERQREIVWSMEALSEQQIRVSESLGVSPPVVNKQLKAANYEVYHQSWINLARFLSDAEEWTVSDKPVLEKSFALYYSVGQRRRRNRDYSGAHEMFRQALAEAENSLCDHDPAFSIIHNAIAKNLISMHKFNEAKEYIDESLRLQENLPRSRLEYAATLNILGDLYFSSQKAKEASRIYREAKRVALDAVGQAHPFARLCDDNVKKVEAQLRTAIAVS